MKTIEMADLFCGAGGTSTGAYRAADRLGLKVKLSAVNHWGVAIDTHQTNHPDAQHFCASLSGLSPRKVVPSGKLRLLVASPECTNHSNGRGNLPMDEESRASAWHVLHWCEDLQVDDVIIENVPKFQQWGPLGADNRPLKSRKGETFNAFIRAMQSLNYTVEWRVLNAADYGDPTTRERLFIRARRGKKRIHWPAPTHSPTGQASLFGGNVRSWRPARDIIDWSIHGTSIFNRPRPLAPATLARIAAGIRKYWGEWAEPFLVILRKHADAQSIDLPLPTVTAGGTHIGLVEPFVIGQQSGAVARGVSEPIPTIATKGAISLVQPFILPLCHGKNDLRTHSINEPLPTITSFDAWGMVRPFLVKYYGTGGARSIEEPLDTITGKDRFGLVSGTAQLDILFRMLQPHELAAAMGFPSDYEFTGTREERVKQIGNAVPVGMATELCAATLAA